MKDTIYIVMTDGGVSRITKRWPMLSRSEIAVEVRLSVPDSSFRSPILRATLDVAENAIIQPTIEVEALDQPEGDGEP